MSLKYKILKCAVKASRLKNRGKMSADEIIEFKKKQNAKIGIPEIKDKEITVSKDSVMGFPVSSERVLARSSKSLSTREMNLYIISTLS